MNAGVLVNKEDKNIILNKIHNLSSELERELPLLRDACKFGLRKGKLARSKCIEDTCIRLAGALGEYMDEDFSLSDMQDYIE